MELTINNWEEIDRCAHPGVIAAAKQLDEFVQLYRFLRFRKRVKPPFLIRKSERPDFVILTSEAGAKIGIEVTWAAHQPWEEGQAYLRRTNEPRHERVSRNWLEGTPRRGRALGQYLEDKQSDGWVWSAGEQAEAKTSEVVNAIKKKADSLSEPSYQRQDENWLLIVDRCPFLFLDTDEFEKRLANVPWRSAIQYDEIYFVTELRSGAEQQNYEVLFDLGRGKCRIVGRLPASNLIQWTR